MLFLYGVNWARGIVCIFGGDCDYRCHLCNYFGSLLTSAVIFADAVMQNHESTEADVEKVVGTYLRYAPDRKGGYRRKEDVNGIE